MTMVAHPVTQIGPAPVRLPGDRRPLVWLLDIDGTLALRRTGGRGPYDYDRVHEDVPNDPVVHVVQALVRAWDSFVVVSGRLDTNQCRTDTHRWLRTHVFDPVGPTFDPLLALVMRPLDMRAVPDEILKEHLYRRDIEHGYRVRGVFDNRPKVVRVWRDLGLTCFDVEGGDF